MPAAQGKTSPDLNEGSGASHSDDRHEEFVYVNLSDIRKDVQCSICLGIIRKTRTVMECLHRFCRECIDKSMRLGNNECPVCRTHCASRRSLRDDLNFDALIAVLYPDVDSYEDEELALREEDKRLNSQLQASIAETSLRQSDAIARRCTTAKATAAAIVRKAHSKLRNIQNRNRSRSRSNGQDHGYSFTYEDDDLLDLTQYEQATSMGDPLREKRIRKRKRTSNFVLDTSLRAEITTDDEQAQFEQVKAPHLTGERFDNDVWRKNSSADAGNRDGIVTWARAGARSHMRYGSLVNSTNNRHIQCMRSTALLESLAAAVCQENNSEFGVHFTLIPFDPSKNEEKLPSLEKPNLCCPAGVTAHHICKFLVSRLSLESTRELEILVGSPSDQELITERKFFERLKGKTWPPGVETKKATEILHPQATLGQIHNCFWDYRGNLVLMYRYKV